MGMQVESSANANLSGMLCLTHALFFLSFHRYMKYLYPYECEKKSLSTPAELQAAIDGNRREGRRTSYGQFESQMQQQLQMVNC